MRYPASPDEVIMFLFTQPGAVLTESEVGHDDAGTGYLTVTVIFPFPPHESPDYTPMIDCDRCVMGEDGERIDVRRFGQPPCGHV